MQIRLNKFLAQSGICSRRAADKLIEEGRVFVNGKIVKELGVKIDPEKDQISLNKKILKPAQEIVYYAINKPVGYTSTSEDKFAAKKVTDLVSKNPRVFAVGRLDKNSEGLMILTNDGELTNRLTHPKFGHEKEYEVVCRYFNMGKARAEEKILIFKKGIMLSDGRTYPATISNIIVEKNIIKFNISIHEGRKRQIRRMCDRIKMEVVSLKRVRIGKLLLDDLKTGSYKKISKEEII